MPHFISPLEIRAKVTQLYPASKRAPDIQAFWGADAQLYLPDEFEVREFLRKSPHIPPGGGAPGFDCDDYSYAVKGAIGLWNVSGPRINTSWCVGVMFAQFNWMPNTDHAANWFMDKGLRFHLFEPQRPEDPFKDSTACTGHIKLILV